MAHPIFLLHLFLLSLLPSLTTALLPLSASSPVCIIGAGSAGLSTASSLAQAKISYIVLEARARAGGRIYSSDALGRGVGGNEPAVVDLGASWIEGDRPTNPIYPLIKPFLSNSSTVLSNFNSGSSWFTTGGTAPDPLASWPTFATLLAEQQTLSGKNDDVDPSLAVLVGRAVVKAGMNGAQRLGVDYQAQIEISNEYAAQIEELSGWEYDSANDAPGKQRLWRDGYITAFKPLISTLNIAYSTIVTSVTFKESKSNSPIQVATNRRTYTCSRVVVTVPLGVLKANTITFTPPLPSKHLSAITSLGFGTFNKIALRFPPSALPLLPKPTDQYLTFVPKLLNATNTRSGYYDLVNFRTVRPELQNPILIVLLTGSFAKLIESLPPTSVITPLMAQLRSTFGNIPSPIASAITNWGSDPFALGSYSFMAPGTSAATYKNLGAPVLARSGVPWLVFAGEAAGSWPYPSTVHGAYLAGMNAAKIVVASRNLS